MAEIPRPKRALATPGDSPFASAEWGAPELGADGRCYLMCVCVCVCVCIIYVYLFIHSFIYIYIYILCVSVSVRVSVCVCIYVYMYIYIWRLAVQFGGVGGTRTGGRRQVLLNIYVCVCLI